MKNKTTERRYKNMKGAILLMAVMLLSVFASASLSTASLGLKSENNLNLDVDDLADVSIDSDAEVNVDKNKDDSRKGFEENSDIEIRKAVKYLSDDDEVSDLDFSVSADTKETSFANVFRGTGWITGNNTGKFVSILWVEKNFELNSSEELDAKGLIKISSEPAYKLSLVSSSDEEIVFSVKGNEFNGTLELDATTSLVGFTVWEGKLKSDSGKEYEVSLATVDSKSRSGSKVNLDSETKVKTKFKLNSDIELSIDAQDLLNEMRNSLNSLDSKVKIVIEAQKEGSNVTVNSEVEGNLTSEQEDILEDLKEEIRDNLESAEDGAQLELEIESEAKTKNSKAGFWKKLMFWNR